MYRIKDKTNDKYFGGIIANVYGSKQEVLQQLITFHKGEFEDKIGLNEDIWHWVNQLETEVEQLNALLNYGNWDIEEIKEI